MCSLRLKYVVDVDIIQRFEGQFDCLKHNGELVYFRIRILKNNAWQDWVVENGLGDLVLFLGTNRSFVGKLDFQKESN